MAEVMITTKRVEMLYEERGKAYAYVDMYVHAPIDTIAQCWSWQLRIA